MAHLIISNIIWDTDGEPNNTLPNTVVITNPEPELISDLDGYAEEISDYLSDTYGFCVEGFATNLVTIDDTL